jgi:hypothetical protein
MIITIVRGYHDKGMFRIIVVKIIEMIFIQIIQKIYLTYPSLLISIEQSAIPKPEAI